MSLVLIFFCWLGLGVGVRADSKDFGLVTVLQRVFCSFFFVSLEESLFSINFHITAVFSLYGKYRSYFPVMTW